MLGVTFDRFAAGRMMRLRLGRFRLELQVPWPGAPERRVRSHAVNCAVTEVVNYKVVGGTRLWGYLFALAISIDLVKLGFVQVWAETAGLLSIPEWLPDEARIAGLMAAYVLGISGVFFFTSRLRKLLRKRREFQENISQEREDRGDDPPGESRRCGVPVRPRGPSPLVARARRSPKPSSPAPQPGVRKSARQKEPALAL